MFLSSSPLMTHLCEYQTHPNGTKLLFYGYDVDCDQPWLMTWFSCHVQRSFHRISSKLCVCVFGSRTKRYHRTGRCKNFWDSTSAVTPIWSGLVIVHPVYHITDPRSALENGTLLHCCFCSLHCEITWAVTEKSTLNRETFNQLQSCGLCTKNSTPCPETHHIHTHISSSTHYCHVLILISIISCSF